MKKIAIVGNPPASERESLDALFNEDDLRDLCHIAIYSDDRKSDEELLSEALLDSRDGRVAGIVCLSADGGVCQSLRHSDICDPSQIIQVYVNSVARLAAVRTDKSDAAVTVDDIKLLTERFSKSLKRDFNILNPRIAILSVNKEITDSSEELTVVAPAMNEVIKSGIQVFGPFAYQGFFDRKDLVAFDGVIQVYADHVSKNNHHTLDAMRKSCSDETVCVFTGLDTPVVSCLAEGVFTAICTVLDMINNRKVYDIPLGNPLPKLFHERKEDGEKARFAKVKKGFNPAEHRRENVTYTTSKTSKASSESTEKPQNTTEVAE